MIYIADAHALIWFFEGDSRLSEKARRALADSEGMVVVPSIVMAEIWHLCHRHRITAPFTDIMQKLSGMPRVEFSSLDISLFPLMPAGFELHDAIIVATAKRYAELLAEPVSIINKDAAITEKSGLPVIW